MATWTAANLPHGQYEVFTRWLPNFNRATNAPFTVYDGVTNRGTVLVNEQLAMTDVLAQGVMWKSLGVFTITSGSRSVSLNNKANNFVIGDAVRFVLVQALPGLPVAGPLLPAATNGSVSEQAPHGLPTPDQFADGGDDGNHDHLPPVSVTAFHFLASGGATVRSKGPACDLHDQALSDNDWVDHVCVDVC